MKLVAVGISLVLSYSLAHRGGGDAQEVVTTLFESLQAARISCPEEVRDAESRLFCASTVRDASYFRETLEAVDADTLIMRPTGNWGSYEGKDVQRSYLYRDGFMTVALYEGMVGDDRNLVIVRTLIPHD